MLILAVGPHHFGEQSFAVPDRAPASYNNVEALGEMLFTQYVLPFEIAGVILLVAMIAAIGLAFRGRRSKVQVVSQQTFVRKEDRLKIIRMPTQSEDL